MRRADDDHVFRYRGCGVQSDFAGDRVDLLIVIQLQVEHAAVAEAGNGRAGFGVERDQPVAGRDVEDAFFLSVGPVSQTAAGELPGRRLAGLGAVRRERRRVADVWRRSGTRPLLTAWPDQGGQF